MIIYNLVIFTISVFLASTTIIISIIIHYTVYILYRLIVYILQCLYVNIKEVSNVLDLNCINI